MKKNKKVRFVLTINYDAEDTFPTEWDEDQIKEYIKRNFEEYIEEPKELDGIYIYEEKINENRWDDEDEY